tara:strand:- start:42559 stop:43035 length:477 start_codon:yes stop_codon:yes gene_type:complete
MLKIIIIVVAIVSVVFVVQRTLSNKKTATENIQKGAEFLEENQSKDGVQVTASGLQYQVLNKGTGSKHPSPSDHVKVHYHGTLIDGTIFDSSMDRGAPIEFGLHQVIPGWTEGLQLMVVGEKTRFFIPGNLAYGSRSMGIIGPGSTLIFDVELLDINE